VNNSEERGHVLFCSSVSPQPVAAGELLVYRHFSQLQSHKLLLVVPASKPPGELPNVTETALVPPPSIWLGRLRRGWLFPFGDRLIARQVFARCNAVSRQHKPTVVVTVFVPDTYMTAAAAFAQKHRLPLVLICHDDYEDFIPRSFRATLAKIYRQAAVRLCVSEPMATEFQRRYGVEGAILHPIPSAPARLPVPQSSNDQLLIGFAGSVRDSYEDALLQLADNLQLLNGQVVIASPSPRNTLPRVWSHPAVVDAGQVAPEKVQEVFNQAGVNVMGVVQSFDPKEEQAYRFNFPSKLTEYSTFGLPLLILAPESASAVTWARSRAMVAAISTDLSTGLKKALNQLTNAEARQALAMRFFEAASEFAPERAQAIFEDALNKTNVMSVRANYPQPKCASS